MHGLTRVRGMTQDDSHSYVTAEQAPAEIKHLLDFVLALLRDFGLDDYYLELSTRETEGDKKDKFIGSDEQWEVATDVLERRRDRVRARARARPGWRRVLRPEDLGPGPRRDRPHLADVDHPVRLQPAGALRARVPGVRRLPPAAGDDPLGEVRLDRAVLRGARRALRRARSRCGSSPVQVARHPGRRGVRRLPPRRAGRGCGRKGIRVELDASDDRFPKKIRNASKAKVPYVLIAGEDDRAAGAVSFRYRDGIAEERRAGRRRDRRDHRRDRRPTPGLTPVCRGPAVSPRLTGRDAASGGPGGLVPGVTRHADDTPTARKLPRTFLAKPLAAHRIHDYK